MPEKDGEEMTTHLEEVNACFGHLFKKISINGKRTAPLFTFLKEKQAGFFGDEIKWGFTKFLIDKNGQPVRRFSPSTPPSAMEPFIEELLAQ